MPRPAQWPPRIYSHSSGQSRIRVNGRDYYLGKAGSAEAKAEYARLIVQLTAEGKVGPPEKRVAGPGFTVNEVLDRFRQHAERTYSKRGRELDQFRLALQPLSRLYGDLPAAHFDAEKLRELQDAMLSGSWMTDEDRAHPRRPKTGGVSRGVVNHRVIKIRTVWRWAEEMAKLVPPGSWAALRVVRPVRRNRPGAREGPGVKPSTLAEVKAVCRHAPPAVAAMLLVQFWSGMRSGEVRIMRAGDVDRTGEVWLYRPRQHKTDYLGHSRVIMLGRKAQAVLAAWLQGKGPDDPVFPSPGSPSHGGAGNPYTMDGYAQAAARAAKKAGIKGFRPYGGRHATRMRVSREVSDEAARSVLGQRSLDVALRYGSTDLDLAKKAAKKLG